MTNQVFFVQIEFGTPEFDRAVDLRDRVLRQPLKLEFTEEQIAEEFDQIHFACFSKSLKLLACLTFQVKDTNILKMRQVAVDPDIQNKSIGTQLVAFSEEWAKTNNFNKIILHARDIAIPFYLKLKYKKVGNEFEEVGIKHFAMEKSLK